MDMEVDAAAAKGTKRRAGTDEASGLEEDWRWEEQLRGSKVHLGSCWDRGLRPDVRELLLESDMLTIRTDAILARSRKEREDRARRLGWGRSSLRS